ncbi:hypothetical protein F7725_006490 [Dissostichus mawsoni]|uniref:Promyelocytic leukemia zinc finger protein n=1 Tax=Dissostichus mawsoni TaxID=36200 RepID=A0A7J5XWV9_DISMA|nr:hypothetical protein F7725_006490 [Dissostichus mawsoni]
MDLSKMGMIQLQNPNHPTGLLLKANQMRLAGTLCDVVILVDNQEFHAHRTVLACTSKMFEILFHRSSQHYTLDFLSPKTFQQILEYAYTATLQAKVEDLDDLLYAAEILEIEYLEEQCLKILETIQSSDENDVEVGGSAEEEDDRKGHNGAKNSKKHTMEGSYLTGAQQMAIMTGMVDQSPSVSTSFGMSNLSPTKAAVDSLMSIGQSLLQQGFGGEHLLHHANSNQLMTEIKTEMMQVDMGGNGHDSPPNMESSASSNGERMGEDRNRDGPGTPTRSSVITSARELHYVRDDQQVDMSQIGLEAMAGMTEKHLASLYSLPVNHKSDGLMSMPAAMAASMASQLPMSPALAMSMDFSAYGALLPQSFIQREFFSKLGELAVGMKPDGRNQHERCNVCGIELPDNEAVEQHKKMHSGMKTYGCELCGKSFLDSLRLRMHCCLIPGEKAIVCDQCGAQFQTEESLESHRKIHTGSDMALFCLLCGKRFQAQPALQQHMEVHAGVRSYICSECNRTFPSHTALKRHIRSHTGEKPFECKLCHQRSRDYSAMIKHLRTHNGASPYQCTICLEYCPSLSSMQKHMKGHKPEDVPPDWRIEKTYLYLCYV